MDGTIERPDGRTVGYADLGVRGDVAVLWCHGGPGSRREPAYLRDVACREGLRIVGIDRPGYGMSTPQPGRTIGDWVPDALAVADHLGIEQFVAVGVSTGGAYALALAALAPERVLGVVPCCAVTDMRHGPARDSMSVPHAHAVWDAPDRAAAIAAATEAHGEGGSKMLGGGMSAALAPSDLATFQNPAWMHEAIASFAEMFRFGSEGYADDRRADGGGWTTFDVAAIRCPVVVLHGELDRMVSVVNAHHTASIVPGAELLVVPELGHFSIDYEIVPTVRRTIDAQKE